MDGAGNAAPRLDAYWMPFTANRRFKADPRTFARASGMSYWTEDGREVLDATSGLWCVNAGHCRPEIAKAIADQAATLDYATAFNLGHPKAFQFAERLAEITPEGLDRIFFANSGSEAVETALKMALAYHRARGQGTRTRLIGRERGYHGVNFGGISVGGLVKNRMYFGGGLPGVDHLPHTHDPARNGYARGQPVHGAELADALERLVALHDASTIAAVIVEPLAGSTGVLPPPVGYLDRLREICTRHGILLIFDEVITGFGRLGAPFAAQRFGVTPDLMTMAKGITNAAVPMGAVAASRAIHDTLMERADGPIELFHGYTYSGHPLACAAGLATLGIYEGEGLFERARGLEGGWESAVHGLRGAPHVVDIRNFGLTGAIELQPRPGAPTIRALEVFERCFDRGVLMRVSGDTIALSPPLIAEEHHFARIAETIDGVLREVA